MPRKGGVQRSGGSGIRFADSDDLSEAKGSLSRFPDLIYMNNIYMSEGYAYWIFCFALLILLMILFGQYIQRQYWSGNMGISSPGGPPNVVRMALNQNPVTLL